MAFTNIYNYVRKINEGHLQFYIDTSTTLEDSESVLIVILWSHNKKQIMTVKNNVVLGTTLKQGHEAKNINLNAQWNVKEKYICGRKFHLVKGTRWPQYISISISYHPTPTIFKLDHSD
jgi:hypothetical protein